MPRLIFAGGAPQIRRSDAAPWEVPAPIPRAGPVTVRQRDRGFGAGELLAGIAAAQLAGEDFLTGLDRQRADVAGQQLTPVPGLASATAAGLARRLTPGQWRAVEAGLAVVTGRMLSLLTAGRVTALADGPVTIDLDTADVEVYGRKKRGVACNHQGQRVGRPHVASWAETEIVLAAALGDGTGDPRATAPGLLRRALAALPVAARAGRVAVRADAGYFAGQLARAAHDEKIAFATCPPPGIPAHQDHLRRQGSAQRAIRGIGLSALSGRDQIPLIGPRHARKDHGPERGQRPRSAT